MTFCYLSPSFLREVRSVRRIHSKKPKTSSWGKALHVLENKSPGSIVILCISRRLQSFEVFRRGRIAKARGQRWRSQADIFEKLPKSSDGLSFILIKAFLVIILSMYSTDRSGGGGFRMRETRVLDLTCDFGSTMMW